MHEVLCLKCTIIIFDFKRTLNTKYCISDLLNLNILAINGFRNNMTFQSKRCLCNMHAYGATCLNCIY